MSLFFVDFIQNQTLASQPLGVDYRFLIIAFRFPCKRACVKADLLKSYKEIFTLYDLKAIRDK